VVFLGAAALLNPLAWRSRRSRWCRWWSIRTGSGSPTSRTPFFGVAQAMGPIGAWLAVTGEWSWDAVILGLGVGIWIGGFDLIFGSQDVASDRAGGVKSVPARFGVPPRCTAPAPATP